MRMGLRGSVIVVLLAGWAAPPPLALAATLDTTADRVIGQADFFSQTGNLGADGLSGPMGAVLDAHGNLYVADNSHNRVLEYDAPLNNGAAADRVFGQP